MKEEQLRELVGNSWMFDIALEYKRNDIFVRMDDYVGYEIEGENVTLIFSNSQITVPLDRLTFIDMGRKKRFYVEEN